MQNSAAYRGIVYIPLGIGHPPPGTPTGGCYWVMQPAYNFGIVRHRRASGQLTDWCATRYLAKHVDSMEN